MSQPIFLEICTDSVTSCVEAEKGGAARVELCAGLFEGGLTPSAGTISLARQQISIGLHILIRPRAGDFLYSKTELEVIKYDIDLAKKLGADGVVIGILNPDGTIDTERTRELVELAKPMKVTFHRAFDMVPNPLAALEILMTLGVDFLLTSGQEKSALDGSELLKILVQKAGDKIKIMPGGGITDRNISRIFRETGATHFHLSARKKVNSQMQYRPGQVFMGGELRLPEFENRIADYELIRNVYAQITG